MKIKLRDYQLEAINNMHNGCILCGGVGSGKSITSLAYFYILNGGKLNSKKYVMMKKPKDLYIITTAKKRDTNEWDWELSNFYMSQNSKNSIYPNQKVIVDSWNNIKKYSDVKDAFFIFDEQRLVGSGVWVKTFLKIAKFNEWILLSATPGDKWEDYIPVFLANGFYKNKTQFTREHLRMARWSKFPKVEGYLNVRRLERLRSRLLVDMTFKRETVRHVENVLVSFDINKYKQVMRSRWDIYKDEPIQQASSLCYVLRRLVNEDDSRQAAVLELVEKHDRMIIFYNFDYERDILLNLYYGEGFKVAEWSGHAHQPIPDSDKWIYLVQYTAGCEGWNCVKTNCIVFYSQNYSYKVVEQASGRIDRMNTPYAHLYYYHLRSNSGIDLAIARALSNKKKFNERSYFGKWESKIDKKRSRN